jgi:NitT/TauT family transport system ATP-binding protein
MPAGADGRPDSIVELRGVAQTFDTGTRALADVDLDIRAGEFLTIVGPSGCGKSTLLRLIAGLARPTAGRIAWWGEAFDATGGDGRRIGFVFQSPTLMPWASVAANVRLPLDLGHVPRSHGDAAVARALARVGLSQARDHLPRQLSGGMQMRASIARALVTAPDLLLMDDDLLALWRSQRFSVVFVTHSLQEAVFLSTRVVVMGAHPGRILEAFDIDEPYPRGVDYRLSPAFAAIAQRISACVAKASAGALPDSARGSMRENA